MPKPRRDSSARPDTRPAFARPPGARAASYEQEQQQTPRRAHRDKAKSSPAPDSVERRERRERRRESERRDDSGPRRERTREREREREREPERQRERERARDRAKYSSGSSANSGTQLLSSDAIAKLNAQNHKSETLQNYAEQKQRKKDYKNLKGAEAEKKRRKREKNRNVSGAILEEGRGNRGDRAKRKGRALDEKHEYRKDSDDERPWWKKKRWLVGLMLLALAIIIPVAVVVSNNNNGGGGGGGGSSSSTVSSGSDSSPQNTCDSANIPESARGTYTDISTWMDTADFNCTYTAATVGGLSVMGLNSEWDDSTRANENVPPLDEQWEYGTMPIRGVNIGGWLQIEPFITPSLFNYPASDKIVDERSLSAKLGSAKQRVIEQHYATFITKQDFADIRNAGMDHVRIPYPYWAVQVYDDDPFLAHVSWRYLLRAIEYARENGLRVNLDLHSAPGSQNGWTHSGQLGDIDWVSGPNGATNAQRTLDIHDQLSQFFAQDRYKNVVTIYGLVNEPKMLVLPHDAVIQWNEKAVSIIRGNGIEQWLVFGDGFLALTAWDDMFKGVDDKLVMDTHQYQIFNVGQLQLNHQDRVNLACSGWTGLLVAAANPSTGWGPILDGEWSQADTDCTPYLNNVGVGSRWTGTLNMNDPEANVLTPTCPSQPCSCSMPNGPASGYSDAYRQFLKMYAEAQMHSFEQVWGWFYWTWKSEDAVQWSWKLGMEAKILPEKAYAPDFKCDSTVPDFGDLSGGV